MKTATLGQVRKILDYLEEVPREQVQSVLGSGLLNDLLSANIAEVSRAEFRKVCGLIPYFPIWKTIKLGTGLKTADDFRASLKGNGFKIGDWANDILGKPEFVTSAEGTEVDLVKVTVAELGFKKGARRDQIYERAKELGLELCPPEVGPQLRLQYKDQPNNEWILIGMDPIRNSGGDLGVFGVERSGSDLWLRRSYDDFPGDVWGPDDPWVFVRPRK